MNENTTRPTHLFLARRRRGMLLRLLTALLALTTVLIARPAGQARADSGLCLGGPQVCGTDYGPPALLNAAQLAAGTYAATPAQLQSLQKLETLAIANTIADHGLPAGDALAVQTWGRSDAEAELFALLVRAIQTPACGTGQAPGQAGCRTTDQQNAVGWLTAVVQRNNEKAAQAAGLEYVRWAGLNQTTYQSLIANNATQDQFQSLLSGFPTGSSNGGGYCSYRSPAPYESEYTGYNDLTCAIPCPEGATCNPPTPSYDQFVKWGGADVNGPLFNTVGFERSQSAIAKGVGLGGMLAGAGVGAVLGTNSALGTALIGTSLQKALFPFGARSFANSSGQVTEATVRFLDVTRSAQAAQAEAEATGETVAEATTEAAAEVGADAAAGAAEAAGVLGFTVGVTLAAIAIAVQEGITVATDAALPGQLASLIAGATTTPDLGAMLSDTNQATSLFSLFVGATMPTPRPATCDNASLTTVYHISGGGTLPVPCLNAPPVPDLANGDFIFDISPEGSAAHTYASSLTWADSTEGVTTTVRMSGNWFVSQSSVPGLTAPAVQTLRIHYTDWSGRGQTGWFVHDPAAGYKFFTVPDQASNPDICFTSISLGSCLAMLFPYPPSQCIAGASCSYSSGIDYVGTDGKDYSASVLAGPPLLPTVAPTVSASPIEGSPITFTANGSSPLGLPLTYQWAFQPAPVNGVTTNCILTTCPVISGAQVSNTWPTSGAFQVTVIATDPLGKQASDTFTVNVGDVPPTLTFLPTLTTSNQLFCEFAFPACESHTTPPGGVTRLDGTIAHAGTADTERVDVNWGDGTPDDLASIGTLPPLQSSNVSLSTFTSNAFNLSASHSYAAAGTYHVTVTVTDQVGGTAAATTTETVAYATSLAWPAPAAITYGTPLGAAQLDAAAGAAAATGPAVTVPGTFAYSVDGSPVTPAEVLPAGPHTLTVRFTPTDATLYTTPDAVSVPLTVNQAPLTITASSAGMVYNGTVPAITPGYSAFVTGESAASLTTAPTCASAAPGSGTAGTYQTNCTGAADANYGITYVPGTLTIAKANTSVSLAAAPTSSVFGQQVTLTASVAVQSPARRWSSRTAARTLVAAPPSRSARPPGRPPVPPRPSAWRRTTSPPSTAAIATSSAAVPPRRCRSR